MPAAAHAAPHWYSNGRLIGEGVRKPFVTWGVLSITTSKGGAPFECAISGGGYVENPVGGGAGKDEINGQGAYNCKEEECELGGGRIGFIFENEGSPGQPTSLAWPGELTEAAKGMIRDRRTNVRAYFNCQYVAEEPVERAGTGPSEGLEEKESKEFNAAGATTCTTALPGSSEARVKNGSNSEKPSKLEFDTGAGELECGAYKLLLGGSLKIAGFIEGELLTAKIP